MKTNLNILCHPTTTLNRGSPKNSNPHALPSPITQAKPRQSLHSIFQKVSLSPEQKKFSPIKIIPMNFKLHKTFIEERMKSVSPKSSPKFREETSTHKQSFKCFNMEEDEIIKKYRRIRIESQENHIKINQLFRDLCSTQKIDLAKCIDICFEILALLFKLIICI